MPKDIVSSFQQLEPLLPKGLDVQKEAIRLTALKHYLGKGGVLHVARVDSQWPKLLYPSRPHLRKRIDESKFLRDQYGSRLNSWRKKFNDAKVYHVMHNVKKFKEPLFWKHTARYSIDRDYRKDSDKVKLPVHLVADRRWKPMIKMFISDIEYRKQLVQTVDESIVYRKNKRVAQYADLLQKFRMEQSNRKIAELQKKIAALDADITALQEIARWASG